MKASTSPSWRARDALEKAGARSRRRPASRSRRLPATSPAQGRSAALAACPEPDILLNNADGPLPGDFRDWSRDDWIAALDAMMLSPIEMMRLTVDGMMARGFGRIVNIVSRSVKIPQAELGLSNGALRTGRLRRRPCPPDRLPQRHHQQSAAGHFRQRRAARARARWSSPARASTSSGTHAARPIPQNATGARPSSAYCAFLCSSTPASSPGKIC